MLAPKWHRRQPLMKPLEHHQIEVVNKFNLISENCHQTLRIMYFSFVLFYLMSVLFCSRFDSEEYLDLLSLGVGSNFYSGFSSFFFFFFFFFKKTNIWGEKVN